MIAQARLVVLKKVAQATASTIPSTFTANISSDKSLSQFGKSLTLSTCGNSKHHEKTDVTNHHNHGQNRNIPMEESSTQQPLLQSSNSLLKFATGGGLTPNKQSLLKNGKKRLRDRTVSVTWDSSVNDLQKSHSIHKKPKRMNSLKRSIQSFGKPGSDHFQSAKNATFAEFGHLTQNPNFNITVAAGQRNDTNQLSTKTHHLSTMNLGARHTLSRSNIGGDVNDGKNMNASFDFLSKKSSSSSFTPPSLVSSHSLLKKPTFTELARSATYSQPKPLAQSGLLSLQAMLNPGHSRSKQDMERTPTMLENILLKKTQKTPQGNGGGNASWDV